MVVTDEPLEPAPNQLANLVKRFGCEAIALHLEALQVLGEPYLEAENFQYEVGLLQQLLAASGVLRADQDLQQVYRIGLVINNNAAQTHIKGTFKKAKRGMW